MARNLGENSVANVAASIRPETEYIAKVLDENGNTTDVKFRIMHWSPTRVYKMIPRIGKIIGVPAAMLMGGGESFQEALAGSLLQMFQTFEEEDIMEFIEEILTGVIWGKKEVVQDLDQIFMRHPQVILQLVIKVLEVTYSPFTRIDFTMSGKALSQIVGMNKATA